MSEKESDTAQGAVRRYSVDVDGQLDPTPNDTGDFVTYIAYDEVKCALAKVRPQLAAADAHTDDLRAEVARLKAELFAETCRGLPAPGSPESIALMDAVDYVASVSCKAPHCNHVTKVLLSRLVEQLNGYVVLMPVKERDRLATELSTAQAALGGARVNEARYLWLRSEQVATEPWFYPFWKEFEAKLTREERLDRLIDTWMTRDKDTVQEHNAPDGSREKAIDQASATTFTSEATAVPVIAIHGVQTIATPPHAEARDSRPVGKVDRERLTSMLIDLADAIAHFEKESAYEVENDGAGGSKIALNKWRRYIAAMWEAHCLVREFVQPLAIDQAREGKA